MIVVFCFRFALLGKMSERKEAYFLVFHPDAIIGELFHLKSIRVIILTLYFRIRAIAEPCIGTFVFILPITESFSVTVHERM